MSPLIFLTLSVFLLPEPLSSLTPRCTIFLVEGWYTVLQLLYNPVG